MQQFLLEYSRIHDDAQTKVTESFMRDVIEPLRAEMQEILKSIGGGSIKMQVINGEMLVIGKFKIEEEHGIEIEIERDWVSHDDRQYYICFETETMLNRKYLRGGLAIMEEYIDDEEKNWFVYQLDFPESFSNAIDAIVQSANGWGFVLIDMYDEILFEG